MKNTKIMAILALFLATALFIGAASAAYTLTVDPTTAEVGTATTFTVNLTNTTAPGVDTVFKINISNVNCGLITLNSTVSNETTFSYTPTAAGTLTILANNSTGATVASGTVTVGIPAGYRTVNQDTDAFVYEHITVSGASGKLTKYSEGTNPTALNQISGIGEIFYLTESAVNGQYGAYYYEGVPSSTSPGKFIYIWYPELSLQAELTTNTTTGATSGDSINGKTINKNTQVSFLINSPKVAPAMSATAKIVFTTPAGGKTTTFGSDSGNTLANIPLTGTQTVKGGMTIGDSAEAGTWTAQAEYLTPPFNDYAEKSNTVSFTVQSTSLTLTAAKDSVVRSNPFTVTIQGDSQMMYFIYLDGASENDVNPTLQPGQSGMKLTNGTATFTSALLNGNALVTAGKKNLENTWGYFETDASGKRVVQYNTAESTEDKTYTIKVYATGEKYSAISAAPELKGKDYDTVKVKVEKGAVTISASGDGSYYIGDEIKLTGTNTDSDAIYLFITGPNLLTNGEVLKQLPTHVEAYTKRPVDVAVKTDNTWEYKWDTSGCGLDTGAYTVYATSAITNGKASDAHKNSDGTVDAVKLSDSEYATVSVNLKQPFLSAVPSGTVVAKGDKIYIRGSAEGDPSRLQLYIFGPNKYVTESITVEDDGTYEKKLDIGSEWSSNQYFVVIEHPMYNGKIDVEQKYYNGNTPVTDPTKGYEYSTLEIQNFGNTTVAGLQASFVVEGTNKLQGSNAADALTKMIDSANIDDIYTKLTFTVAEPWIKIVNPGDQAMGSKFTITGTTNLAADDQILVEVVSSSFNAVDKTSTSLTSGVSQTTKVVKGEGTDNTWSVEVDTTNWKLDEYTIKAGGIEVDVTTTTNFNLVEKVATPTPTATGATPTTTATATATATATPATPGFGAFIALAGLGAVALLVLRRN